MDPGQKIAGMTGLPNVYGEAMPENKEFFSVPETAAILGISRIAVFKKVKKGRLRAIRVGRNWAVPLAAVEELRAPRTAAAPPPARPTPPPGSAGEQPGRGFALPEDSDMNDMGWD